jgi:DNA-binding transcriptional regulator YhcF (GntR family)
MNILNHFEIDENSRIPKYQQIVNTIITNISNGKLKMDEKIPSINMLSEKFSLSRDTVEKAYNLLKERNIITSVKGKGNYVTKTRLLTKINILFLVNKLSSYKMRIYNTFLKNIGTQANIDLHIYHCDESIFLNLLKKNAHLYDYFLIMPHFKTEKLRHISMTRDLNTALRQIPSHKLIIMDNNLVDLPGEYGAVYQDFKQDIYTALKEGWEKIKSYKRIILAYPEESVYPYPKRILHGFRQFCVEFKMEFEIISEIYEDLVLHQGDLFITITEHDLVTLVKEIRDKEFFLGKDVGIISYNDTPLKDLLGITVISTDFDQMGKTAAEMILNKQLSSIKNPFRFIDRQSL